MAICADMNEQTRIATEEARAPRIRKPDWIRVKAPTSKGFNETRKLMRDLETHVISNQAHMMTTLWWRRISVYRSYVKGWKTSPSHYLNQHLDQVWLDK